MAAQLALYELDRRTATDDSDAAPHVPDRRRVHPTVARAGVVRVGRAPDRRAGPVLCAACHAREARYGFRTEQDDPQVERPRTLCFECFRLEMGRRQEASRTIQVQLPLEQRLAAIDRRRRRAQIAARKALGL